MLKQKLLAPILQVVFPILSATPPPGEQDPEDEEKAEGDGDRESPKHFAAQVTQHCYLLIFSLVTMKWLQCLKKKDSTFS